jgi:hypothetical protein
MEVRWTSRTDLLLQHVGKQRYHEGKLTRDEAIAIRRRRAQLRPPVRPLTRTRPRVSFRLDPKLLDERPPFFGIGFRQC